MNITTLTPADNDYPYWLRFISGRPHKLYVQGRLPPSKRCVACIGTRQPTQYGQAASRGISRLLAQQGWSIISGLALGVDTHCHEAALEVGGHTVAVLANGLDTVYPRQNKQLADRILSSGGALISEQVLGTPALPQHLTRRNRIQSGMSVASIVMQTDLVGGTMHTVKYTLLQKRALIAPLPWGANALETKSRGLLALTQRTGEELARIVEAQGSYAELLSQHFAGKPVATPVASRDDYPALLETIENFLVSLEASTHAQTSSTEMIPENQLELF